MPPRLTPPSPLGRGKILPRSLKTLPRPGFGPGFVLPILKLYVSFTPGGGSSTTTQTFIQAHPAFQYGLSGLAKRYPEVEFIVRRTRGNRHPLAMGVYSNTRTKQISLRSLPLSGIQQKLQLLLDSTGEKIRPLKKEAIRSSGGEDGLGSVRGIWSAFHEKAVGF